MRSSRLGGRAGAKGGGWCMIGAVGVSCISHLELVSRASCAVEMKGRKERRILKEKFQLIVHFNIMSNNECTICILPNN
jgi:hypothetical protein